MRLLNTLRKIRLSTLLTALFFTASIQHAVANEENASTVQEGLLVLAKEIVSKSVSSGQKTIAVLPFPHGDGTCSVLSTYIVDELVLGMFNLSGGSPVTIIERAQLEALMSEMQIGAGGLLNPETTKQLGNISGVEALTIGTITQIGDRIRINARMVNTETGTTISAAAVTVPQTGDVTDLMKQRLGKNIPCGANLGSKSAPASGNDGNSTISASGEEPVYEVGGVKIQISKIAPLENGGYRAIGSVTNTTKETLQVQWVGPTTLLDGLANAFHATTTTGIVFSTYYGTDWVTECNGSNAAQYTGLIASTPRTFSINFPGKDNLTVAQGDSIELAGLICIVQQDNKKTLATYTFPGLPIPEPLN